GPAAVGRDHGQRLGPGGQRGLIVGARVHEALAPDAVGGPLRRVAGEVGDALGRAVAPVEAHGARATEDLLARVGVALAERRAPGVRPALASADDPHALVGARQAGAHGPGVGLGLVPGDA